MLKSEALEYTLLTIPHTCMYNTYKASYELSKLTVTHRHTDTPTDICTPIAAFAAEKSFSLINQLEDSVCVYSKCTVGEKLLLTLLVRGGAQCARTFFRRLFAISP